MVVKERGSTPELRLTSVQRITFPLALNSDPWKILTLVMDSMDFPSIGLMTLNGNKNTGSLYLYFLNPSVLLSSDQTGRRSIASVCAPGPTPHPLLKLWSSSVHWMWTASWLSSWSAFPHVTVKSFMSFRACRSDSIVSAVIWIITPSADEEGVGGWGTP